MNGRNIAVCFLSAIVVWCFAAQAVWATDGPFDPLKVVTSSFPGSVKVSEKRRLVEFCPDETCDGFLGSGAVLVDTLKDFAYLYIYFFFGLSRLSSGVAQPQRCKKHCRPCALKARIPQLQ